MQLNTARAFSKTCKLQTYRNYSTSYYKINMEIWSWSRFAHVKNFQKYIYQKIFKNLRMKSKAEASPDRFTHCNNDGNVKTWNLSVLLRHACSLVVVHWSENGKYFIICTSPLGVMRSLLKKVVMVPCSVKYESKDSFNSGSCLVVCLMATSMHVIYDDIILDIPSLLLHGIDLVWSWRVYIPPKLPKCYIFFALQVGILISSMLPTGKRVTGAWFLCFCVEAIFSLLCSLFAMRF